jgi:hypothetical protein
MIETVDREVDGLQAHCTPLARYPKGALLGLELLAIAAPALAGLAPAVEGSGVKLDAPGAVGALLAKLDAGQALQAIADALKKLVYDDPARFHRVSGQLLRCVSVELEEDGRIALRCLDSDANINRAIDAGGGYARLLKLLWFSLEVNYGGPLAGAFGGTSKAAAPSPFREG